jgi:CRP-like cAMP-binding protein
MALRIVPFVPGRRPSAEIASPGLGSSEDVAVILPGEGRDRAELLYESRDGEQVRARAAFIGPDGTLEPVTVPGWEDRLLDGEGRTVAISPAGDLLPGSGWRWEELGAGVRDGATDGEDPFTFGHLFCQRVLVELRSGDASDRASLLVCDLRRCGTLYARLLERLVVPDAARQGVDAAYHPWYPVLRIGADKAALYTRALVQDITGSGEHLSDPGWLLRVGLYLEFLTFLGIVEAVREDAGDLLTPAERAAFETSPWFAELRESIDPRAWRTVWALRGVELPRRGTPRLGPVSALNLLAKKRSTLGFLHVHHDDLKHAIRLAGVNHHNAQETWQRVFRDAERAVLRNVAAAFPELDALPGPARSFVLWHRRGRFLPGAVTGLFADQDGLYASACTQYRDSMNDVADWAKARGLMDHTGEECVPRQVSLLEAHVNQPARVAVLQRFDGYGPRLEVGAEPPETYLRPAEELATLLAEVSMFAMLAPEEIAELARSARPLSLGPTERLVVQGQAGGSLFVLAEGRLEVMLRDGAGADALVDTMGKGAVIGEMSLLTGEPRNATVRALDGAVVYEIGTLQYRPVLEALPELIDVLAELMAQRLRDRAGVQEREAIASRIRRALFG